MSLISKVKLPGQNTPYDIGVQWDNVKNKPTLATVATSGDYNDLSNIPDDKVQIFTATFTGSMLFNKFPLFAINGTRDEFNIALASKVVYITITQDNQTVTTHIITGTSDEHASTLLGESVWNYKVHPNTSIDLFDGGITTSASEIYMLTNGQFIIKDESHIIPWSDHGNYGTLIEPVTGRLDDNIVIDLDYNHTDNNFTNNLKTKLENLEIPTDISTFNNDAGYVVSTTLADVATTGDYADLTNTPTNVSSFTNDANYVTQTQLNNATAPSSYPHFEVSYNGSFSCYYVGSLPDSVNSVTTALQCDEVKYALRQLIPVYNNGTQVFIGSADIINIDSDIGLEVRFPDATAYAWWLVNGIKGVLTYDSSQVHSLYLTNINTTTPHWWSHADNVVAEGIGINSIGSSTTPVYWTGSNFEETVAIPTVPTQVSAFTNDANYINQTQLNNAISNINSFNVQVVASLPTTNIDTHTIYFISNSGSGQNIYDEYMYLNNTWEKIGTTDVDLSGYLTSSDFTNVSAYTSGGQVTQADFTTASITPATFANVTASKASAGTAVSVYKGGGAVSQTSFTSGAAFTIAEGTVTANSAYQDGGTVSQAAFTTQSITPYTFTDVTASKATTQTAVTVHTGGGTISQTPFGTTTTSHVNS